MQQLQQSKYESLYSFFPEGYPNSPIIYAILEEKIPGQIWVDDNTEPRVCLVMTGTSYCFIKGNLNEEVFKECLMLLKQKQMVKLALEPHPEFYLSRYGFVPVPRRQYQYKNINNKIPVYENNSGYQIVKIKDIKTFDLCIWKTLITDFFGSAENYLKNGIGFILWDSKNQIIASESHGIPSKKFIEIGTITHENYRGQKLSTILCNHLIRYAIQNGLQPVWTCDETNTISWKVAENQGMDELKNYTFFVLAQ